MSSIINTADHATIDNLARKAAAGTLKRIHTASANKRVYDLMLSLQADFAHLDNPATHNAVKSYIVSDAYDVYLTAYDYLYDMIAMQGHNADNELTVTLKGGKDKTRTVYQWACVAVRRYVYANKSVDNNGKYVYIEDMSSDDQSGLDALDREYVRMGKYDGIDNWQDYNDMADMINTIGLTDRQETLITLRLRGMSVTDIAIKLGVSKAAISKQLTVAGNKLLAAYPHMANSVNLSKWTR